MAFTFAPPRQTLYNIIDYKDTLYVNYGDFHCHTVFSLHGLSSPTEVVDMAVKRGITYVGVGDHFYPMKPVEKYYNKSGIYYDIAIEQDPFDYRRNKDHYQIKNQVARVNELWAMNDVLKEIFKNTPVHAIPMYEYNLFTFNEGEEQIETPHLRILGLHDWFVDLSKLETNALISEIDVMLDRGGFSIFAHPERELTRIPDFEENEDRFCNELISLLDIYNVIMEINTRTIKRGNPRDMEILAKMIRLAREKNLPVVVDSDAHHKWAVGDCIDGFKLLESEDYPAELIMNFDADRCEKLKEGT